MNKKIMIVWGMFVVTMLGSFLALGLITERENKDYVMLENNLIEASKLYISQEKISLKRDDSYEIDINILKKGGYVDTLVVHEDTCKGSVLVTTKNGISSYKAHIKCGNYESLEN